MDNKALHNLSFPVDAKGLVPHRPPMLLIDKVLAKDSDFAVITAEVPSDEFFLDQNGLLPEFLIEIMAQGLAAADGIDALEANKPKRKGFLVGVEDLYIKAKPVAGEQLRVELKKETEFANIVYFFCELFNNDGELLANGKLKVWLED